MNQHLRKKARLTSFLRHALKPLFAVCALAPVFAPHHAAAQTTYYWEVPAGGNWDFTTNNWSTTPPPSAATVKWNNGVNGAPFNSIASFGVTPTAGDTAITVNQSIILGGLNFTVGNLATNFYDIQGGAGSLTFTGQAVVTISTGVQALISIPLTTDTSAGAASDTLTFTGAGTVFLNGNNSTYTVPKMIITGGATVTDSIGGGAIPNVPLVVGVTTGPLTGAGTLDLNGATDAISSLTGAANGTITNSNTGTYASLTIGNATTPNSPTTFAGQITDSVGAAATTATIETTNNVAPAGVLGITINAPASGYTLILTGTNNNYNGMTVVGDGTNKTVLQAGAANTFSKFSAVNVLANGTLDLAGFSQTIAALNGTGAGTVTNTALGTTATLTLNGDLGTDTLSSNANIVDHATNNTLGTLNLLKTGGYTQILAGTNTYGGTTTITTGQLAAGSATGLSANSSYTVTSPGILNLNTFSASVGSLSGNGTVENVALATFVAAPVTLTTGTDNTNTTFSGGITGTGGSALTLTKTGTGIFTLTGGVANTYSGGTNINQGTLSFSTNSLSTGLVTFTGASTLQYQPGTTQDTSTINGLKINNGVTGTIDTNNNNVTFATALQTGGGANSGALTKTGLGTLTLGAANVFTGGLNINQGTVAFTIMNGLGAGPTTFTGNSTLQYGAGIVQDVSTLGLRINAGITGTLDTNGNNETLATSLTTGAGAGLTKIGAGVLTIGGTNTYTGATTVNAGTVKAGTAGGLSLNSAFTLATPAILDVNGFAPTIGSLTGTGTVTNGAASAGTLITGNDNTSTTFSGLIKDGTGTTALTKTGTGAFTLNTANTYSGGTTLQSGTLIVANSNALGIGNVTVSGGALQAGGTTNNIIVGKNYTQTSGGELDLRIGGTTTGTHDQLTVAGAASVSGKLSITAVNGYTPKNGDVIPIVTAGGGVSGTFAPVTGSLASVPLVKLTVNYLPGEVDLDFGQGSFMAAATILQQKLTPNEKAVATALDHVASNAKSTALLAYLDGLPFASLPGAYDRIAPEEYGAVFEISRSAAKIEAATIENRLDEVHAGAPAAGGFTPGANGPAGPEDYKGSKEVAPPPDKRLSVFANGSGEFVNVGDTSNAKGYNFDSGAATVGVDYLFTDHFLAGVLLNYTGTEADLTGGGRIDANAFRGGVYATLFGGGAYVNAFAGGAYSSYDVSRQGLNSTVRGNTDGSDFNGLITTGYDVHTGGFTYGPVASFQYTYTGLSGFNETGSLAPLHIQSDHGDSILTNVGARASYDWHIGNMVLVPEVRATWQHEYGDTSDAITAAMLLGSPVFRVTSAGIGRDSLVLNAGFTLKITADISAYAFYDGELARTNYQANNVMVGFRTSF